jgi:CheY-like chemotaxis protein
MKGPEAVSLIRGLGFTKIPIFGLTGNVMPDDVRSFVEAGVDLVLEKPLVIGAFVDAVMKMRS